MATKIDNRFSDEDMRNDNPLIPRGTSIEGAGHQVANEAAAYLAAQEGLKRPLQNDHEDNTNITNSSDSPEDLAAKEKMSRMGSIASAANMTSFDQVGKGFSAAGGEAALAAKAFQKLASSAKEHKKGLLVGGGAGGGIIIIVFFAIAAIVPYEITHIEKNLMAQEAKVEQRVEQKAASKLMQKMVCWQLKVGCKKAVSKDSNKPTAEEEATAEAEGEKLTSEMDNFNLEDPAVQDALAKKGITVNTDGAGNITSITDQTGKDISQEIGSNDVVAAEFQDALPEFDIGQRTVYEPLMVDEAGVTFRGLPDTTDDNVDKTVSDEVVSGANETDIANAAGEASETNDQAPKNSTPATQGEFSSASEASGKLGDALNATEDALKNGASDAAATEAGVSAFGSFGDPLFLSSIATTACSMENEVNAAAKARVPTIMMLLMRHGNLLLTVADQMKTGHITSAEINQFMQLLNGNPAAKPETIHNKDGTTTVKASEATLPFSSSATWQQATGGNPGANTPGILASALPTANSGTKIVDEINSLMKTLKLNLACHTLTSWFGTIVQVGMGIAQIATDIGSFGTSQIAITAGVLAVQSTLQYVVLPQVIQYFTPVGLNGLEDSVQLLNNAGAGLNLSSANYARRLGMQPVTTAQASTIASNATQAAMVVEGHKSFSDRMFALSDPRSLASHLADEVPIGTERNVSSVMSSLTSLPSSLMRSLATIVSPSKAWAQATNSQDPGLPYDVIQYGFTSDQIEKYNPVANEQYLFSTVSAGGNSVKRIDALGNPNSYVDSPSGDSNNNDLLHCYVDPFWMIEEQKNGADNHCHSIGYYDNQNYSATDVPTDSDVVDIYCNALGNPANCANTVAPQVSDDVGHFEQYLLDGQIMNNYTNLTKTQ